MTLCPVAGPLGPLGCNYPVFSQITWQSCLTPCWAVLEKQRFIALFKVLSYLGIGGGPGAGAHKVYIAIKATCRV